METKRKKNSPPQFIFTPQEVTPPAFAVSGPYLSGRRGWQSHAPPQTQNGAGFGRGLRASVGAPSPSPQSRSAGSPSPMRRIRTKSSEKTVEQIYQRLGRSWMIWIIWMIILWRNWSCPLGKPNVAMGNPWKSPRNGIFGWKKSSINDGFSSKPCLIIGG